MISPRRQPVTARIQRISALQAIVVALSAPVAEGRQKDPIFRLAEPPVAHLVFRFAPNRASGCGRSHRLPPRRENIPPRKSHCSDRPFPRPPRTIALPRSFSVFITTRVLPAMMSFIRLFIVRLGDVADAACAEEGDDVPTDAAHIDLDRRGFLGAAAFAHDQAGLHIFDILFRRAA